MNIFGSFKDPMMYLKNQNDKLELYGLSQDVDQLPTENVVTGSTAYCVDTQDVYIFEETTSEWYKQ